MNAICDTTAKSETISVKGCKVKITYAPEDTDCLDAEAAANHHPAHGRTHRCLTSLCSLNA